MDSAVNNGGGKRKMDDDVIELAKQKAQAIAARLASDADAKRPRSDPSLSSPPSYPPSQSSFPVSYVPQTNAYNSVPSSKKIVIPNAKVGVIIGRGGDMIKNLQQRSGARIQITRDADADRTSLTRDVELMGTQEQISRAEELINEVIAETDAASSISSGVRNVGPPQPGSEQFVMKVPNDKVALVIGKGGETIKSMQTTTGARIQVVPLHLPPGDTSTERNVFINGTTEQIEAAKELVNEVISGNRLKVLPSVNTYTQSAYTQATGWPPQGQPPAQQPPAYGYTQAGSYPVQPPYYGGYPPQPTGWEQAASAPSAAPSQQQNTGYNAYGQVQPSSTPPSGNYNYSQVPPATGYNYNQGYPQQPPYGQDMSAQAPTQAPAAAPATYGPPATSSQPDGSAATAQTSQPGYGAPVSAGQPEGTSQTQAPSAYPTSYTLPAPAPANGYGAYPGYSGAPSVQPTYTQAGYQQAGYGQQQGQVANEASYSYYGQSGYQPSQAPAQAGYYQGSYLQVPPGQGPTQAGNGVNQSTNYGTDGGEAATGSAAPGPNSGATGEVRTPKVDI